MSALALDRREPPQDPIALQLGGLHYGPQSDPFAASRQILVPKELDALTTALHGQSQLLALKAGCDSESIFNAYGFDLTLMHRYRGAFKATIEAAVLARADERHVDAQAMLAEMAQQLGDIGHEPKLELGEEAARLEPNELLERLQKEFRSEVEDLKQGVVMWLHDLTQSNVVSVIQWHSPKAITYHFFRVTSDRKVGSATVDPGMSLRGRWVKTTTRTDVTITQERRDHTILNAKRHALDQYPNRVPARIALFINAIPPEVRPFVDIVDGTVSKERVVRNVDNKVTEETHSVWKDDPTPALFGTWALAGWGGSTPEAARALYIGHATTKANNWLIGSVIASVIVTVAAGLGGGRPAVMVGIVCLFLVIGSQFSMRVQASRGPQRR